MFLYFNTLASNSPCLLNQSLEIAPPVMALFFFFPEVFSLPVDQWPQRFFLSKTINVKTDFFLKWEPGPEFMWEIQILTTTKNGGLHNIDLVHG